MALLLEQCRAQVIDSLDAQTVARCTELAGHAGDGRILADACSGEPDYFVTLDKRHLLDNAGAGQMSFPIGTPGDCIAWLRSRWAQLTSPEC
jgi:hypothetical protein